MALEIRYCPGISFLEIQPAEVIEKFTLLIGRQPLPPLWALGYLQSRASYHSQQETNKVVEKILAEDFPIDAIIMDESWFGGIEQYGHLDWEKTRWPDPWKLVNPIERQRGTYRLTDSALVFY